MLYINYLAIYRSTISVVGISMVLTSFVSDIYSQGSRIGVGPDPEATNWLAIILALLVGVLLIAILFRFKAKKTDELTAPQYRSAASKSEKSPKRAEATKRTQNTAAKKRTEKSTSSRQFPVSNVNAMPSIKSVESVTIPPLVTTNLISIKTEDVDSSKLPFHSFDKLVATQPVMDLEGDFDLSLLSAIDEVREESDNDEEIRTLAVRILAAYKTANSIDALAQVALYDISSNLRSIAVSALSEFDHESVFETILLACADPTREVRAAAARALFQLKFDRADAWARIANLDDHGTKVQMARAAIEADLVERSFERLVHPDNKYAYEAFALITLLIRAGETKVIEDFLLKKIDPVLRNAIIHTIEVNKDHVGCEGLVAFLEGSDENSTHHQPLTKSNDDMGYVVM